MSYFGFSPLLQTAPTHLEVAGRVYPLAVKRHAKSRRISLRYEPLGEKIVLTLPKRGSLREAMRFAQEREAWLAKVIAEHPARIPLLPGSEIPILGEKARIIHSEERIGVAELRAEGLFVTGKQEYIPRRLKEWLKQYLKREISLICHSKALEINKKISRVTVKDMRSRWGSCSSDGVLAFSRRLVFAPREVMEYVACHEVAHLAEMGHNAKFWKITEQLCPHTETSRNWLKENGKELYRFG